MIFQLGISLDIKGKDVQAVIDLDTGLIGFTEKTDDDYHEYDYYGSPLEFKKAFLEAMMKSAAPKTYNNLRICRKGKAAKLLQDLSQAD